MKNDKLGVSAVIGVILMVAITVAIASTVYVYIMYSRQDTITPEYERIEFTGILQGCYTEANGVILINNTVICNIYDIDFCYLSHLIGKNITLLLDYSYSGFYNYVGAYLNK